MSTGDKYGTLPGPDPSVLTTQHMIRETEAIRELVFREILALEKSLSTRMDAADKAVELLHEDMTQFPTDLDKEIAHLKELHGEKFTSIQTQFSDRDARTEENSKNSKVAVDAALQAAEKAVGKQQEAFALATSKSEAATAKQIDQQGQLIANVTRALDDRISDLKERLTRIEGSHSGREGGMDRRAEGSRFNVLLIGMILSALFGLTGIVIAILKMQ